jgi:hypothetical protein
MEVYTLSRIAGKRLNAHGLDILLEINCPLDFDSVCEGAATYGSN